MSTEEPPVPAEPPSRNRPKSNRTAQRRRRVGGANTRANRARIQEDLQNALDPTTVEITAIELRTVQLRIAGLSFKEIADQLGYGSAAGAHSAIKRALQKWGWHTVDEYRKIELTRLDVATRKLWPGVLEGDVRAIQTFLRVSERRARLLGLDAPTEVILNPEEDVNRIRAAAVVEDLQEYLDVVGEIIDVEVAGAQPAERGTDPTVPEQSEPDQRTEIRGELGPGRPPQESSGASEATAADPVLPPHPDARAS